MICGKGGGSRSMHCLVEMNFCCQLLVRDWHYHQQIISSPYSFCKMILRRKILEISSFNSSQEIDREISSLKSEKSWGFLF